MSRSYMSSSPSAFVACSETALDAVVVKIGYTNIKLSPLNPKADHCVRCLTCLPC
jgi:hypothetical protein